MREEAKKDRNFAATLFLEAIGQTPSDERELVRMTAGATLIIDAFADLRILRLATTEKS